MSHFVIVVYVCILELCSFEWKFIKTIRKTWMSNIFDEFFTFRLYSSRIFIIFYCFICSILCFLLEFYFESLKFIWSSGRKESIVTFLLHLFVYLFILLLLRTKSISLVDYHKHHERTSMYYKRQSALDRRETFSCK